MKVFSKPNIVLMFFGNVFMFVMLYIPYVVNSDMGLDDLGMCGLKLRTPFLKIWFQTVIIYIFLGYIVSLFCGYKVIKKVRGHKKTIANTIQVIVIFYLKYLF